MTEVDPRRRIPRTDALLALPAIARAVDTHGYAAVRGAVREAQDRARRGEISVEEVASDVVGLLPHRASSMTPVVNATGVVVHTNIGRAPLSRKAIEAMTDAAGYVDVELDLETGRRAGRGRGAVDALLEAVPAAASALVVNNGAAALVLATTALAAGREVVVSRGQLVEIGDGFRLPDLMESTGARLCEVGTTNRTHLADYAEAVGPQTGCVLVVHPSNFRVDGFTSTPPLRELADLTRSRGVPLVMDIGSGLLAPEPALPAEPDAATTLADGASIVTASGDKLLGGPQAGIVLGDRELVARLRRHPLARALRVDKLTLAAVEATVRGPLAPVTAYVRVDPDAVRQRTVRLAEAVGVSATDIVAVDGRVGGGGAPGVPLAGWALALPEASAQRLRASDPAVLTRVERGRCLLDLRCVDPADDERVAAAVRAAIRG